ncbi:MAG: hypothetical protein HOH86_05015, partial [Verrucomicrobiales bacterium]|nr:hypothetical protein [Verrucomicrobiales bacterium]
MKLIRPLIVTVALSIVCVWAGSAAQNNTEPLVQIGAKWEVIGMGYQASDGPAWDGRANLYFPDVRDGKIWRYNVDDKKVPLVADDRGGVYHTFAGKHSVFYLNPSGKLIQVIDDIKRPNGITLSLDG